MKNTLLTCSLALLMPLLSGAQTSSPTQQQSGSTITPINPSTPKTPVKKVTVVKKTTVQTSTTPGMGGGGTVNGKANPKLKTTTSTTTTTTTTTNNNAGASVTQSQAASAIKQALINGITTGVNKVSVVNGYFGNPEIKIPLPAQLQPVDNALRNFGAGQMIDKLVEQLNHSAEQAATQATPIFLSSINQLTITDAINIISNQQQDAATAFLKRTTTEQLVAAFKPKIKLVLDETKTNEIYGDVMKYYNDIPFVEHVDADLADYVTRKALDGLFIMIAKEEAKIRQDPKAQVSTIISTVFGKLLHK